MHSRNPPRNRLAKVLPEEWRKFLVAHGAPKRKYTAVCRATLAGGRVVEELIVEQGWIIALDKVGLTGTFEQRIDFDRLMERTVALPMPARNYRDLAAGKTDGAILWGPLAGMGMIDLGLEDKVSVFSVDRPKDPPPAFMGQPTIQADACAAAIADDLDSFGVLPAELLVPVYIRSMLNTPTPVFSMQNARQGGQVFQQVCARCHGPNAVWDPALAPVNLLNSIRRFQFIGFKYIVMNGRAQKGMPPLRGTVTEDQIALIFQYLQARSKNELTASSK